MSIKIYKPTTPGRRQTSVVNYKEFLTTSTPEKSLLVRKNKSAGRSANGKITVRHIGGGARKLVRLIDYKRSFADGFKVLTVEYDPNRSAFISLVLDLKSGKKSYIINTKNMKVGDIQGHNKEIVSGNHLKLKDLPVGSEVSQVELRPGEGAKLVRGAGTYAIVTAKDGAFVSIKLPSSEIRKVLGECLCVVSRVSNESHNLVRLGKAGRTRRMGIRPTVRGKAMNPVDHPHGGGEGRNSIGLKYPKTPWGKHALGVKTRKPKNPTNKFIVSRRKKNK